MRPPARCRTAHSQPNTDPSALATLHRQCLLFEFSAQTGKIVKVRAYFDTEVMAEAKRANGVPVEDEDD